MAAPRFPRCKALAVLAAGALAQTGPAHACDLALLLAIDISGSVDDAEYKLQIESTAGALEDPLVTDALVRGDVAVAVVQWSSYGMQKTVLPWRQMQSRDDVLAYARAARALERAFGKADTAVADAITYSVGEFDKVADCSRRVIDISGDGIQNAGGPLPEARERAIAAGITVNAIAIESIGLAITEFYRRHVITRDGFVMTSRGHSEYPEVLRAKLVREILKPVG